MNPLRFASAALSLFAITWLPRAAAAPLLFSLGPDQSELWPGFTRVTAKSAWSPTAAVGWESIGGLSARAHAYREPVANAHRGTTEPPPIWTNPITEAGVLGDRENALLFRAPPGDYELYLVCGTSEPALRTQFFDFTVHVGDSEQRVQIEGCYQFRTLRFRTHVDAEPLRVVFTPRSKWVVNAVLAWTSGDRATVERDIIGPFETATFRLPPTEAAKWKADPVAPEPMPVLSPADQQRGFLIYSRHYLDCVFPETRPTADELNPELRVFATPGEYATTNFVVLPMRPLHAARVAIDGKGPLAGENVDIRHVRFMAARPNYTTQYRYRVVPDILEHFDSLSLPSGENARFWITIHVPETAPAGDYRGTLSFESDAGRASVPLRLRVLPIHLEEDPAKIFGIYYRHPLDQAASAPDEMSREHFRRKAELEHQDMVAHGTRNVVLGVSGRAADTQGDFHFNWDLLAAKLALWQKYAFVGPVVLQFPAESVCEKYLKERPGSHLRGIKDPPEEYGREITAMVAAIESERKRRGWPEFIYYPIDEPGSDPASIAFMVKTLQACKAAGVRTYVTADPTHAQYAAMRPYVDVWSTQPFAPDRDTVLADTKARGVEYWCYPNHVNGENDHTPVKGARMTYGFGFWRSGFRTLIPWIYQSSTGDPFNYLDGATMDFFNRSEPDGAPLPVALWEAYRQGYNDYRYVYTLERRIAAARDTRPAVRAAADAAQSELDSVWRAIRVQPKYKYDGMWPAEDFDAYRWLIARQILLLDRVSAN